MDAKPMAQSGGNEEELRRLRLENQRLRAEGERARLERDNAEARYTGSQTKVAELEHRVRTQSYNIDDLKAEVRTLRELSMESRRRDSIPPPLVAPIAPDVIEISGEEEAHKSSGGSSQPAAEPPTLASKTEPESITEYQTRQRQRQFMECTDAQDATRATSSGDLPAPRRFKRLRSVSPQIQASSASTLFDHDDIDSRVSPRRSSLDLDSLPTLRSVSPVKIPPAKRLKKYKSEDFKDALLRDVSSIYLKDLPNFDIAPAPSNFLVPRKFLLDIFGVLNQTFIGYFKFHVNHDHDARRRGAIFPQPDLNPLLPDAPGAPGLIFASRFEIVDREIAWALFCKRKSDGGKIVWRYMGQYENTHSGDMTAEQFKSQAAGASPFFLNAFLMFETVKQQWGKLLLKSKKVETYIAMRARIALRKAGVAFVPGDAIEKREMEEVTRRGGRPLPVGVGDIVEALERGDESIGIIKLECVSYDHELAADMARRHEGWALSLRAGAKAQPGAAVTNTSKGKGRRKNTRIAKPATHYSSSEASPDSDSDFSSPESEDEETSSFGKRRQNQNLKQARKRRRRSPDRDEHGLGSDSCMSDLTELEEGEDME
ncbi:hypothetical protein DFH08DRAFT_945505 [Mycena albidolilacea]|uniref:DUF6697 domain-containing protein n=1 Tax=Mycena albidolilacea TaxID=1033008 RepID=A0AAD7E941_9AGAR|nr:hypothetical protein DFH08DRAFT_945505 [Mycena albidolilacea]